jgi:hypothetical protein
MLFLAVSLGFFVENIRENYVEKKRAEELAKSFYQELKADSVSMHEIMRNRRRRDAALTYMKNYYQDSSIANCSKTFAINFFYSYNTYNLSAFEPNEAILQQLKNSGSLRYFKSVALQKLTDDLSVRISYVRARNQVEWSFYSEHLIPFVISHNDQQLFDQFSRDSTVWIIDALHYFENSNDAIHFQFRKPETFDKTEATNSIGVYQIITRSSTRKAYLDYINLNQKLLKELREDYNVK